MRDPSLDILRRSSGMTLAGLSEATGMSERTLKRRLASPGAATVDEVASLAAALPEEASAPLRAWLDARTRPLTPGDLSVDWAARAEEAAAAGDVGAHLSALAVVARLDADDSA